MQLHDLRHVGRKRRKRVGRGIGSRRGTFSTRGVKGQKARAGARLRPGFEGGQTPLYARLPKRRGFTSRAEKAVVVNVGTLGRRFLGGTTVNRSSLFSAGLVPSGAHRVKILGDGDLTIPLTVTGVAVSLHAREKIEKAGGRVVNGGTGHGVQPPTPKS